MTNPEPLLPCEPNFGGRLPKASSRVNRPERFTPWRLSDISEEKGGQLPIFSGPFNLLEQKVYVTEGMRACQAYGKAVGEKLNG